MANEKNELNQNIIPEENAAPAETAMPAAPEKPKRGRPRRTPAADVQALPAEEEKTGPQRRKRTAPAEDINDISIPEDIRPDQLVVSVEDSHV